MTMPDLGRWTYTHHISLTDTEYRPIDEVRYLYQDTDTNVRLLSDNEVQYQIDQWLGVFTPTNFDTSPPTLGVWTGGPYDHPLMAAHGCALRVSSKFAGLVQISADGVAVNVGDLMERYAGIALALEAEYERISTTGADVDITNLLWANQFNPSIRPTTFGIGSMDNPLAGQQDYGGDAEWPGAGYETEADVSIP